MEPLTPFPHGYIIGERYQIIAIRGSYFFTKVKEHMDLSTSVLICIQARE
jgi:hypothetical protein